VGSVRSSFSISGNYLAIFKHRDSTHHIPQRRSSPVRKVVAVNSVTVEQKPH
jgi:hypothetical protein